MVGKKRRQIPLDVIQTGLKDPDWRVRRAAIELCKKNGIPIPIIRTIEPPDLVYKKCCADVIIVAQIPKDAQVRGSFGNKCRTNKAIIKEVIGDFCGEPVGISIYDRTTTYYAGDEVEIDNFDYSNEECSTGFRFFCTIEEANAINKSPSGGNRTGRAATDTKQPLLLYCNTGAGQMQEETHK